MDYIHNGKIIGNVAQKLLAHGFNPAVLRTNATLLKDEWKAIDTEVQKVAEERLVGVADLLQRNQTHQLSEGFGTMSFESERSSDISEAERSMDGMSRSKGDAQEFDLVNLPLPITHKDFQLSARVLTASRKRGDSLDTSMSGLATRKVAEENENVLFNGAGGYSFGGGVLYGYTDHPNRNTFTTKDWEAGVTTGEEILADVLAMIKINQADKYFGPYYLYVPSGYDTKLDEDFKANSDKSIRERLLQINSIEEIRVSDQLAAGQVVLVQMTSDVVRIVRGQDPTPIEWEGEGGMVLYFKVMSILVPQIRADFNGNSGVCHGSRP